MSQWGLSTQELKRSVDLARSQGIEPRALCVINPGNPTGTCMTRENIQQVIEFAYNEGLVLLVDEVYQVNCYDPNLPFISFREVLATCPDPIANSLELFSFHSISKGVTGEVILYEKKKKTKNKKNNKKPRKSTNPLVLLSSSFLPSFLPSLSCFCSVAVVAAL